MNQDRDWGRFALAAWEIVGFGLGKAFPTAAYMADASAPPDLAGQAAVIPPDMMQKLASADDATLATMSPELEALLATLGPLLFKWIMKKLGITV